jgi:hypothetical protein
MENLQIAKARSTAQKIFNAKKSSPAEVVFYLGAMQSQDYASAKWPIGLRAGCTEKEVISSINNAQIVRTWPMRGTLHYVSAKDIYWMLDLLSFRALQGVERRMDAIGIDEKYITRCKKIAEKVLKDKNCLTREEFYEELVKNKITISGPEKYHIIWRLAQDQLICFAKEKEGKSTIALLEEWIPKTTKIEKDEALYRLVTKYFKSHGPATIHDFQWWSGLTIKDARESIALAKEQFVEEVIDDAPYYFDESIKEIATKSSITILSAFDEFLPGYKNRTAMLSKIHNGKIITKNGLFSPTVIEDGKVIGKYKKIPKKDHTVLRFEPLTKFSNKQIEGIEHAVKGFEKYLNKKIEIQV